MINSIMVVAIMACIFMASWLLGYAECISKGITPKKSAIKSLWVNVMFYLAIAIATLLFNQG